jgi:hypothetical protein
MQVESYVRVIPPQPSLQHLEASVLQILSLAHSPIHSLPPLNLYKTSLCLPILF